MRRACGTQEGPCDAWGCVRLLVHLCGGSSWIAFGKQASEVPAHPRGSLGQLAAKGPPRRLIHAA